MNLYVSDLHFGHENVIAFDNRPFETIEEMDRSLIEFWNQKVQKEDNVYIVGDFAYRNKKPEEWYLKQLKGHKHLIIGNHDTRLLKNDTAMAYFESVDKMMHVTDERHQICLCHFPIAEWNGFHKGHWHIFGHYHNKTEGAYQYMKTLDKALNAGCMINHYVPVTLNELIQNNQAFHESV